ncbi:DUF4376 domain-containing protein [Pseudomonas sp. Q2-TVG4-2]|uniref:DUF4376 domain-containing protein n=1 Tax=Pseudomonas sp. Q2-TVG4-2 TaxID=1685699 RepID=UPI0015E65302|nr:DUF4376 domain-containing protein [Pseudomonas sp. Q2-TVG4-2]
MRHYSKTTRTTYLEGRHTEMPADAVPITEDRYQSVIANPAPGKIRSHDADGLPILIDPPIYVPTDDDHRAAVASRRWHQEVAGIAWQGYGIATDRESQDKIVQETRAIDRALRVDGKGWKCIDLATGIVVFRPTTNAEMVAIGDAVYAYVSACFEREEALLEEIVAGTYDTSMLETGWPA